MLNLYLSECISLRFRANFKSRPVWLWYLCVGVSFLRCNKMIVQLIVKLVVHSNAMLVEIEVK
jgi:hypothetical protein